MLRQVIVLGVDEARALHNSGKNHRASLLAEVVGIVLDVAVAVDFGARPPACPLFGGRARFDVAHLTNREHISTHVTRVGAKHPGDRVPQGRLAVTTIPVSDDQGLDERLPDRS